MDIQVTQTGGVTLVVPQGDLDMGTADHVKRMLTELIAKGQSKLVMDLTGVSYVDSSGLGALAAAMKQPPAAAANLKLCGPQTTAPSISKLTRPIPRYPPPPD